VSAGGIREPERDASFLLEVKADEPVDLDAADAWTTVGAHTAGRRPPLLMIHTWKHEVQHLQHLASGLGADQPIFAISPPRGEYPRGYPRAADEWAAYCLPLLRRLRPEGPYVLGGWSFGGVVALSLAERLVAEGDDVRRVVMFDSRLPKRHPRRERGTFRRCLHHLDEALGLPVGQRLPYLRTKLGKLREHQKKEKVRRAQRLAAGLGPGPVEKEPLLKAVNTAYLRYQPFASGLPVTLFWTSESYEHVGRDLTLGWGAHLRGDFESRQARGTHTTMLRPPNVASLTDALRATLELLNRGRS
jgi:thioesterase domain-containing protein